MARGAGARIGDLWRLDGFEQAELVRKGLVSAREVVTSTLDRLNAVNPKLNAAVYRFDDEALREADAVDAARRRGDVLGPLCGVPVTIKINTDQKGHPSDDGTVAHRDVIAKDDSPVVANFRRAGAVIVGRTNAPSYAMRWFTDNDLHGFTVNPWSKDHTVGGSSGGAGSSIAAGIGAIAHGNDIGGSIRYPAYCCGVAGLRPSNGLIPAYNSTALPINPISRQMMAVQGPHARRVRDLRLAMKAMAQEDLRDPRLTIGATAPPPKRPLRAALYPIWGDTPTHPAVSEAVRAAGCALADAGYLVEEIAPPQPQEVADLWPQIAMPDVVALLEPYIAKNGDAGAKRAIELWRGVWPMKDPAIVLAALGKRIGLLRQWQLFLADWPIIVMPVSTQPPFRVGEDVRDVETTRALINAQAPMLALNVLGLPSASVPTGLHDGVPMGVQVVAGRFQDDLCLDACEIIEARLGLPTPIDPIG